MSTGKSLYNEIFGESFFNLARELSAWSQATFGSDEDRGPMGALKHLEKEAKEAQEDPEDIYEYADCLILIVDAARRAKIKPMELVQAAYDKLQVCKEREYPKPEKDEPSFHVKGDSGER